MHGNAGRTGDGLRVGFGALRYTRFRTSEDCTHNTCAFCNMYQGIAFRMLPFEEVEEHLVKPLMAWGVARESAERVCFVGAASDLGV